MTTIMDDILSRSGLADNQEGHGADLANGDSVKITIEVDDILASYGMTLVASDIFKQVGDLSVLYKNIIHPVIAELYNGTDNRERLNNILKDDVIANHIFDSLESKIWLHLESLRDSARITVERRDVEQLCVSVIELLTTHIREIIDEKNRNIPRGEVPCVINILERSGADLIPSARNPRLLEISLEYYWVYE